MLNRSIYCAGSTRAARFAGNYLKELGLPIVEKADETVKYLLLDVPSFGPDGRLRGGESIDTILNILSTDVILCGGNLAHPLLNGFETVDFLQDPKYLAENAYITAECALDVALPYLDITLRHCPTLIIGWGRIGKCLAKLLQGLGADVTVAARKEADRAMLHALGYHAADPSCLEADLPHYRLIYNTVPYFVLTEAQTALCREDCVKIELSSKDGILGEDIVIARGLPGLHMPESSGKLIAATFLRYYQKEACI